MVAKCPKRALRAGDPTAAKSANSEFDQLLILLSQRMAAKRAATAAFWVAIGRQLWAVLAATRRHVSVDAALPSMAGESPFCLMLQSVSMPALWPRRNVKVTDPLGTKSLSRLHCVRALLP